MAAAHPLAPAARGPFLEAVAGRLAGAAELGDGTVNRACRELQRDYFEWHKKENTLPRVDGGAREGAGFAGGHVIRRE
jgi:hypothetical protein